MRWVQLLKSEWNEPCILKTHDVAVLLDLSPDDVNDMARKGLIKGHKIGKQWRFRNNDVKMFLDQMRNQALSRGGFENVGYGFDYSKLVSLHSNDGPSSSKV